MKIRLKESLFFELGVLGMVGRKSLSLLEILLRFLYKMSTILIII